MSHRETLDPKLDIVFKMLFGHPDNRELLVSFLTAVLRPSSPIRAVYVESEPLKPAVNDKEIALDIHVELVDGQQINVEMQSEPRPCRRERALYYWARMHAGQLDRGDGYNQLCRSVVVLILGFNEFRGERFHSLFRVREVHDSEEFSEQLEVHVLELPKLRTNPNSDEPKVVEWGKFFAATSDAQLEELAMKDPDLRQAKVALERLSADPEARILAEMRDRAIKSYRLDIGKARTEGRIEGIQEGRIEGIQEGRIEGIQEGRIEGQAALVSALLGAKFGPLSPTIVDRLQRASESQLLAWVQKHAAADSLDAVFDHDESRSER
jgi:predicted transposase/invertase (TIGR01784 family)